jgi:protein O-mannosyl-transferase
MGWMESISFRRAALTVAAVCLAVYGLNLTHSFVWDDGYNVVENQQIRQMSNVPGFFTEAWGASADNAHSRELNTNYYRPVALTSYTVDYALFGLNAWGFHLTNVLMHLGCCILVLLLGWRLYPSQGFERVGVLAAALIFAVHPVHTEVVNVITYRTDMLAAFFTLWALILWIKATEETHASRRLWMQCMGVPLLYLLGVLSKEMAFTVPLVIGAYEVLVRREKVRRLFIKLAPLGVVALGYLLIRKMLLTPSPMVYFDINWPTGLPVAADGVILTMFSVVTLYAKLLVAPWPLNPFYEWSPDVLPVQFDPLEPTVWLGVCIVAVYVVAAVRLMKVDRKLVFLWLLLPILLIPVSHAIPIIIAAGERFLYLALAGPLMVASVLLFRRYRNSRVLGATVCLVVLVFGSLSAIRSHQWRNDTAVLEAYVEQWPTSYNAWRGLLSHRMKQTKDALAEGDKEGAQKAQEQAKEAFKQMQVIEASAWLREAEHLRQLEQPRIADCIVQRVEEHVSPRRCFAPQAVAPL